MDNLIFKYQTYMIINYEFLNSAESLKIYNFSNCLIIKLQELKQKKIEDQNLIRNTCINCKPCFYICWKIKLQQITLFII